MRLSKISIGILVLAAFLAGILFTSAGSNLFDSKSLTEESRAADRTFEPDRTVPPSPALAAARDFENVFIQVAELVNPTVVQIHSEKVVARRFANPFEGTPWEDFFNMPGWDREQRFRSQALGSGVIIRSDGYIITNNHVIDGADALEVKLFNGDVYEAEVVGADAASDLAVIKIEAEDLPHIAFGNIDEVRVGQWVMAFGSPLAEELSNTVTSGIISAINRTSATLRQLNQFAAFIQTDAAINPGNSGGPLVDLQGRLIGINSAIYSRSGGYQGIGFAIPVDVVENVVTQLIEHGSVDRGYLGVYFGGVSPALAEALKVPRGAAQITSVEPGTPAEKAGLREGDIIIAVDGQELRDNQQLATIIGNKRPGDRAEITVIRDGERQTFTVTLSKRPDDLAAADQNGREGRGQQRDMEEALGLRLQNLTPALTERLGISGQNITGVLIADIDADSHAFREAELRRYDIITEVDRKPVRNEAEFWKVFDRVEPGKSVIVKVIRVVQGQPQTFFTALTKPASE
ncbi:MAG: serine protease [Rhodothermaceae bacterium]|nr:MAG: serine protease [Rhodothermaceae bacterium]